jgi:hypothetical protein
LQISGSNCLEIFLASYKDWALSKKSRLANGLVLTGALNDWSVGVAELRGALCATWEAEDAQALAQTSPQVDTLASCASYQGVDDCELSAWISNVDDQSRRFATQVEDLRASHYSQSEQVASLRDNLAHVSREAEVASQRGAWEAQSHMNETLSCKLRETSHHVAMELSSHTAEIQGQLADRAAAAALDWRTHCAGQQALHNKMNDDIEALHRQFAEVVDDSVEMRKQVLEMYAARRGALVDAASNSEPLRQQLGRLTEEVAKLSGMPQCGGDVNGVVPLRAEVGASVRVGVVQDSVSILQGEVQRIASRVAAGEQNTQRGLSLLQGAIEKLQFEHAELKHALDGEVR